MNVKIRHTPLGEKVFRRLTAEIENETFKQGAFLPAERELALRFGVSRVVVRETTKRLEQSGFVTSRRGVGVQVTNNPSFPVQQIIRRMLPGDAERLRQSAEARRLIEPELAALAALKATPGAIAALEVIHARLRLAENVQEAASRDIAFHDAIANLAGNKVLAMMLKSMAEFGQLSREVTIGNFGVGKAHSHHEKILRAIAAGDSAAARKAMKNHLEAAHADLS